MATKSKIKIEIVSQIWKISRGDNEIYLKKNEDGFKIKTRGNDDEFVFTNYKSEKDLDNAKVIPELIQEAVRFIKKQFEIIGDKNIKKYEKGRGV